MVVVVVVAVVVFVAVADLLDLFVEFRAEMQSKQVHLNQKSAQELSDDQYMTRLVHESLGLWAKQGLRVDSTSLVTSAKVVDLQDFASSLKDRFQRLRKHPLFSSEFGNKKLAELPRWINASSKARPEEIVQGIQHHNLELLYLLFEHTYLNPATMLQTSFVHAGGVALWQDRALVEMMASKTSSLRLMLNGVSVNVKSVSASHGRGEKVFGPLGAPPKSTPIRGGLQENKEEREYKAVGHGSFHTPLGSLCDPPMRVNIPHARHSSIIMDLEGGLQENKEEREYPVLERADFATPRTPLAPPKHSAVATPRQKHFSNSIQSGYADGASLSTTEALQKQQQDRQVLEQQRRLNSQAEAMNEANRQVAQMQQIQQAKQALQVHQEQQARNVSGVLGKFLHVINPLNMFASNQADDIQDEVDESDEEDPGSQPIQRQEPVVAQQQQPPAPRSRAVEAAIARNNQPEGVLQPPSLTDLEYQDVNRMFKKQNKVTIKMYETAAAHKGKHCRAVTVAGTICKNNHAASRGGLCSLHYKNLRGAAGESN